MKDKFTKHSRYAREIAGGAAVMYVSPDFSIIKPTIDLFYSGRGIRVIRSDETRIVTRDDNIYNKKQLLGLSSYYNIWDY